MYYNIKMMASQKVFIYGVMVSDRTLDILYVCLCHRSPPCLVYENFYLAIGLTFYEFIKNETLSIFYEFFRLTRFEFKNGLL